MLGHKHSRLVAEEKSGPSQNTKCAKYECCMPKPTELSLHFFISTVKQLLTAPQAFYRHLPRGGGYLAPLLFVLILSCLPLFLPVVGKSYTLIANGAPVSVLQPALGWGLVFSLIGIPLAFVGSGVCFLIWKMLGSQQPYAVAFRCVATLAVLVPFAVLLAQVPLAWIGLVMWGLYLLVVASVEMHKLKAQDAWLTFGALGSGWLLSRLMSGSYFG